MSSFFRQIFQNPFSTGGIAPCGPRIVESVMEVAHWEKANTLVELGPGTGVFTEAIERKRRPESLFFAIEINPAFAQATRQRCPETLVYEGDALNLPQYLAQNNRPSADIIISTLPWSLLGKGLQVQMVNTIRQCLSPNGQFFTVMYVHSRFFPMGIRFEKHLQRTFASVQRTKPVWDGPFPMFAYQCTVD